MVAKLGSRGWIPMHDFEANNKFPTGKIEWQTLNCWARINATVLFSVTIYNHISKL